jgi:hypothetical protein
MKYIVWELISPWDGYETQDADSWEDALEKVRKNHGDKAVADISETGIYNSTSSYISLEVFITSERLKAKSSILPKNG